MEEIWKRRSIRRFKDQKVEPEKIDKLLRAAMQAPSAANQQAWEFIVVQEKETLHKITQASPYAKPAESSGVTFVLLGNKNEFKIPTGWEQDLGAAAQNLLLEAVHLGLGGVWLGVATSKEVTENIKNLFKLPEHILPFALISVGYPEGQSNGFVDRYKQEKVHYEEYNTVGE